MTSYIALPKNDLPGPTGASHAVSERRLRASAGHRVRRAIDYDRDVPLNGDH
jgi:hypothetical protein